MKPVHSGGARESLNLHLQHLARQYTEALKQTLGDRLISVALFGSVARGEAGDTSDVDLFIVLESPPRGMLQRRMLLEPARERLHQALEDLWNRGIYVDFVEIIRSREEARRFHPVYLDMTEEAILLYDKDNFLRTILERLRHCLRQLGAQKKRIGRAWYWDLNPDGRQGGVVEL